MPGLTIPHVSKRLSACIPVKTACFKIASDLVIWGPSTTSSLQKTKLLSFLACTYRQHEHQTLSLVAPENPNPRHTPLYLDALPQSSKETLSGVRLLRVEFRG